MRLRGSGEMQTSIRLSLVDTSQAPGREMAIAVSTIGGRILGTIPAIPISRSEQHLVRSPFPKKLETKTLNALVPFIEENLAYEVQIVSLAAMAGISPHHFCRRFKVTIGLSPYACVTAMRMIWAKWLLVESDLTAEEIADCVGIADVGRFRKHFRRHFGVNPSLLRSANKLRQDNEDSEKSTAKS